MTRVCRRLSDERGIAFPLAGFGILAVLSFGLVTLEVGQVGVVASEMQNAADAGAIAGAQALLRPARDPQVDATEVIERNLVTSTAGSIGLDALNIVSINVGNHTPDDGFVANLPPINAVEVVLTETVDNLGYQPPSGPANSTVFSRSVAALVPTLPPNFPLVVGDCRLPPAGTCFEDSCMPELQQVGGGLPQTAWTGLLDPVSNRNDMLINFAAGPTCGAPCNGQATDEFTLTLDDDISIWRNPDGTTKVDQILLYCVQRCYVDAGITRVTVPVVPCELGATVDVLGAATFDILEVRWNLAEPNPGIRMQARIADPGPGPIVDGGFFGTGTAALVE